MHTPIYFVFELDVKCATRNLDLDKIVGFSSSSMDIHSTTYWSIIFFLTFNGLHTLIKKNLQNINLELIKNKFLITSFLVVVFGLLGANATLFNFLNFYYFGQNKTGMNRNNERSSEFEFDSNFEALGSH